MIIAQKNTQSLIKENKPFISLLSTSWLLLTSLWLECWKYNWGNYKQTTQRTVGWLCRIQHCSSESNLNVREQRWSAARKQNYQQHRCVRPRRLALSIFTSLSWISAATVSLSFSFNEICSSDSPSAALDDDRKAMQKGRANQGMRWRNERRFAGLAAGEPNALSVTCCVVMTVRVTLRCYFSNTDMERCTPMRTQTFIIFFYPKIH